MKNIEVEVRSFVDEQKYHELISFFHEHAKFIKDDTQVTYYFGGDQDLRIQKNDFFSKIWMKKWQLHDDHREEIEIKCELNDFEKLEQLFLSLWYDIEIKWFRKRLQFDWNGIDVSIDSTNWYGYIIELEILSTQEDTLKNLTLLNEKFSELGIAMTPKEEFKTKYEFYKQNRKTLV